MPTIIKKHNNGVTYSTISTAELAESISSAQFSTESRNTYIRVAADYYKRNGKENLKQFNGLVLFKIKNLPGKDEVDQTFANVIRIPYTHIAWRNSDGRSVYIVGKIYWDKLPDTIELMQKYQLNGYSQLVYHYSTQLRITIDTEKPSIDGECNWSADNEAFFNPNCMQIFVDEHDLNIPTYIGEERSTVAGLIPGMNEYDSYSFIFQSCYKKALFEAKKITTNDNQYNDAVLNLLAEYCFKSGLPQHEAQSRSLYVNGFYKKQDLVGLAFDNAYAKTLLKKIPYGAIDKTTMMAIRTEHFLKTTYEMRRNILTGVVQWRIKSEFKYDFRDLTQQDINSMTIKALKAGIGSWDKDIHRFINSNDIKQYDPLQDYLNSLPQWDGTDRITDFANRIPTDFADMPHYLHIWMLSMVAHWLGKDPVHGNAIVPLIIGEQGCGKTTFASIILPQQLRKYYNDKVDFSTENDLMSGLSNFALINIDEFDSLKNAQQPTLKYLLSKGKVNFRPAYGKCNVERRRYASFMATTNINHPLVDKTGSRRFICIKVSSNQKIDTSTPIDYKQLYAQLYQEIMDGKSYWLNDAENDDIQKHNAQFMQVKSVSEMIDNVFIHPDNDNSTNLMSIDEIIHSISEVYPNLSVTNHLRKEIGGILKSKGYTYKKTDKCAKYYISLK